MVDLSNSLAKESRNAQKKNKPTKKSHQKNTKTTKNPCLAQKRSGDLEKRAPLAAIKWKSPILKIPEGSGDY